MAKVPVASWVSFMSSSSMSSSFRGAPSSGANPESITTIRSYGFRACAQGGASRNDGVVSKPPRRFFDRVLREKNLGSVFDDILRPPSLARRLPAVHLHHPHFADPARTGNAEHLAGLVTGQMRDHEI